MASTKPARSDAGDEMEGKGTGGKAGNSAGSRDATAGVGVTSGGGGGEPQLPIVGVEVLGAACGPDATRACTGRDSMGTLICTGGTWTVGASCALNERCDTAKGMTQGRCLPMLKLCAGKKTGDPICDGYTRRRCGNDSLRFEEFGCSAHSHCEATPIVKCACDLNYNDDGSGTCTSHVMCPANACVPGGECAVGATDWTCECSADFAGTGSKSCLPTGRCAEGNLCSAEYTCRNRDMTYVCRGQFADWPMPSRLVGAKALPSYIAASDSVVDTVTGLTWQRNVPSTIAGCTTTCTWDQAKSYCDTLDLEGLKDWRLPTRIELVSILDDDKVMPSINDEAFPNTPAETFWSSSSYAGSLADAWVVAFGVFQSTAMPKSSGHRVRCVR